MELSPGYIDGPVSLSISYLKIADLNKVIFIFGDQHDLPFYQCKENKSIPHYAKITRLGRFLKQFFKKSPVCVDFFMEYMFMDKTAPKIDIEPDRLLNEIRSTFADCLRPNKKKCFKYGNVRMHYADIRHPIYEVVSTDPIDELLRSYSLHPEAYKYSLKVAKHELAWKVQGPEYDRYRKKLLNLLRSEKQIDHFSRVILYAVGLTNTKPETYKSLTPKARLHLEFHRSRITKQWSALSSEIKSKLKPLINTAIVYNTHITLKTLDNISPYEPLFIDQQIFAITDPLIVMDLYLLFRMLKPSLRDSKVVIIYAGFAHASIYKMFLESTKLSKPIWDQKYKDLKCVEIPYNVSVRINNIINHFPPNRCSYPTKEEIKSLAEHFQVPEDHIKECLKLTATKLKMSEDEVRNVIWQSFVFVKNLEY